jgi:glycogenin glucosyltransferase
VRPPQPRPLAPAFDDDGWRKGGAKSWDEKAEASSRDGDVEDEGEDSLDEDARDESLMDDESDRESIRSLQRRSRRGSSVSATHTVVEKKEYRTCGVQTDIRETRSQGVQVATEVAINPNTQNKPMLSSGRRWSPSSPLGLPSPATTHQASIGPDLSMTTAAPSPAAEKDDQSPPVLADPPSPSVFPPALPLRISPPPSNPSRLAARVTTLPKPTVRAAHSPSLVTRQTSNDSSLGSPASSAGPMSPPDGQPLGSPLRKGGRVWDPARGVELFKRGSEEVLARFLKMGSWEDENR